MEHEMTLEIRTNRVPRFIVDAYELTDKERKDFDYLDWNSIDAGNDSATFFRYKGRLYDMGEFMRIDKNSPFGEFWHGYSSDSYFSGVLVHMCNDNESIIVGQYFS